MNQVEIQERMAEQFEDQKRDHNRRVALENLKKADEDKVREYQLNKVTYTNRPSSGYFDQFNTSSR
jgi:hypothetical protein